MSPRNKSASDVGREWQGHSEALPSQSNAKLRLCDLGGPRRRYEAQKNSLVLQRRQKCPAPHGQMRGPARSRRSNNKSTAASTATVYSSTTSDWREWKAARGAWATRPNCEPPKNRSLPAALLARPGGRRRVGRMCSRSALELEIRASVAPNGLGELQ